MAISFSIGRVAVSAAVALLASTGSAGWAAEALTLDEAQRIAVGRSQQLVAQGALAAAALEQAVAAGQLPNPLLKFGIDNLAADGPDRGSLTRDFMTMRRVGVMQKITHAEKRQLRSERFERDAQRVQAQRQLTMANIQRDAALAWLDRYFTLAQRELLRQQIEESSLQIQSAESAYRTNRGSQADVFAARAAVIVLQDRLSQLDRQARNAALMLARWVGSANSQRPTSGSAPWQSTSLEADISSEDLKKHPDLLGISAEIATAQTEARLAQANKKSDITVETSYARRGPAFSNMLSFGVSIFRCSGTKRAARIGNWAPKSPRSMKPRRATKTCSAAVKQKYADR